MPELGDPTSYLQISDGVPVMSADGEEVGKLEHVLADEATDIFDGIIIDARSGFGGWRFAEAALVSEMHEEGIVLSLGAEECRGLPEPSENPAVMEAEPGDEPGIGDKLRRAWDYLSGNY